MEHEKFIKELLNKYYPAEVEFVGSSYVHEIVSGEIEFEQAEGGAYMDMTTVLTLLSTAAAFIQIALQVYVIVKERKRNEPQEADLLEAIAAESNLQFDVEQNEEFLQMLDEIQTYLSDES